MGTLHIGLNYKRFVRQISTGPSAIVATSSMANVNAVAIKTTPWREALDTASAIPPLNFTTNPILPRYDAYKLASDYNAGTQNAYAGMVAYRVQIPADAWGGTPVNVTQIELSLHCDRWLIGGIRVAAYLSSDDTPPMDWTICREGDDYEGNQLPALPERADQHKTVTMTLNETSLKYLYIVVSLEDYASVSPCSSDRLEGGALIVGSTIGVTFATSVDADPSTTLPVLATNKIVIDGETYDSEPTECAIAGIEIASTAADDDWKRFEGSLRNWLKGPEEHVSEPAATYPFEIDYVGVGFTEPIRINVFANEWYNGIPVAVLEIPAQSSYPAMCHARCIEGTVPDGDVWMFAFVDKEGDGIFHNDGICGVPNVAPSNWELRSNWQACPINLFDEVYEAGTLNLLVDGESLPAGAPVRRFAPYATWQPFGFLTFHWSHVDIPIADGDSQEYYENNVDYCVRLTELGSGALKYYRGNGEGSDSANIEKRQYTHIGDQLRGDDHIGSMHYPKGLWPAVWEVQIAAHSGYNDPDAIFMAETFGHSALEAQTDTPVIRAMPAYSYLHPVVEFETAGSRIMRQEIQINEDEMSGASVCNRARVLSPRHENDYYRYRVLDTLDDGTYFAKVRTMATDNTQAQDYSDWSVWKRFVVDSAKSRPPELSAGFFAEAPPAVEKNYQIGVGNDVTTTYSGTLPASRLPVDANTLQIADGTHEVTDDGSGNLIGDVGAGTNTINYTTGAYDVTFNSVVPNGNAVLAFWRSDESTVSLTIRAVGWADATVFGHVHETARAIKTLKFESAIPSYPDWMTIRLVGYLIPLSNSATDQNMVLADAEYTNTDLWYGTETSLDVVVDGTASTLAAQPILVKDLSPAGYAAETEFPIVPTDIVGPFAIMFAAGPVDINTGAESINAAAGSFYGLEDWQPEVVVLDE